MGRIRCHRLGLQVLPALFQAAESWIRGGDDYRGDAGPLGVSAGNDMRLSPLYRAFINAGVQAGYPETEDYNGEFQEGFGPMHMTVSGGVANPPLGPILGRSEPTQSDAGHSGTRASDCARWQAGNGRGGERK